MGKRAAPQKVVPAKAAKVAAIAEAPIEANPQPDGASVDVSPVLALIGEAVAEKVLDEQTAEMLKAAAPFALADVAEDRHDYQKKLAELIGCASVSAVENCETAVSAAEKALSDHAHAVEVTTKALDAAKEEEVTGKAAKEASIADAHVAGKGVKEAEEALASRRQEAELRSKERDAAQAEAAEYEEVRIDMWAKLLANEFGSRWQERNKGIGRVVGMLEKANIPPSLAAALHLALKTKSADRGPFSLKVLEEGAGAWTAHIAALNEKIAGLGCIIGDCASAVSDAESELQSKKDHQKVCDTAAIQADNVWCDKATRIFELKEELKKSGVQGTEIKDNLEYAQQRRDGMAALLAKFVDLRDRSSTPQMPANDPRTEEPHKMETIETLVSEEPVDTTSSEQNAELGTTAMEAESLPQKAALDSAVTYPVAEAGA